MRNSAIGVEKETLRVNREGGIAQTPHPRALGAALTLIIGRIHFHAPFPLLLGLAVAAFASGGAAVLFYRRKSTFSGSGATNPPKNRIL